MYALLADSNHRATERPIVRNRYASPVNTRNVLVVSGGVMLAPFLLHLFFQVAVVDGESMEPTLRPGQLALAVRHFGALRRGDIVLVRRGPDILIKRVAYLPGDRVATADQPLFRSVRDYFEHGRDHRSLFVPKGRVVVLGDNRLHSDDSRRFGPVPLHDITGRIVAVSSIP